MMEEQRSQMLCISCQTPVKDNLQPSVPYGQPAGIYLMDFISPFFIFNDIQTCLAEIVYQHSFSWEDLLKLM